MVTAAIYTSGNIGPEFTASARTLCEVFHDIATTMGKREFSWDSVDIPHVQVYSCSCYTANHQPHTELPDSNTELWNDML